ncbi:hypothetical protein [Gordonia sp. CPCC 205333]|uniref:hypothetical protein n=1 Tax=Gordonia sp. CPCC 205333 TaxID=3140790 RepID=UPI003AF3D3E5
MSSPQYPSAPGPSWTPPPGFVPPPSEPPVRPKIVESMAIALELWLVVIVGRAVASFAQYPAVKSMFADSAANPPEGASKETVDLMNAMSSTGVVIAAIVVSTVLVGGLSLLVMWFARQGHNWARMLLAGASMFVVIWTILNVVIFRVEPTWIAVPLIIAGVAAGGALVALVRRDAETWCAEMTLYRQQSKVFAASRGVTR